MARSRALLRFKFLLPGIILIVIGALPFLTPGLVASLGNDTGITQSQTHTVTYFVNVGPGNYSYVEHPLAAGEELTATIAAGPQSVDFFLMNGGNFTAWKQGGAAPSQVYPQSSLDVKNYSFAISSSSSPKAYFMVLVSRSTTSATDALVRLTLRDTGVDPTVASLPVVLIGIGVTMALYGAGTSGGKRKAKAQGNSGGAAPAAAGGWLSLLGAQARCKHCGEPLDEGSSFCSHCGRSQT